MINYRKTIIYAGCLGFGAASLLPLRAQEAGQRQRGPGGPGAFRGPGYDTLSQEEKDKLKAATEKAMQDPKVKEAREKSEAAQKEFRDALQAAQTAADPSLEPILKKLQEAREKARAARANGEQPKPQ